MLIPSIFRKWPQTEPTLRNCPKTRQIALNKEDRVDMECRKRRRQYFDGQDLCEYYQAVTVGRRKTDHVCSDAGLGQQYYVCSKALMEEDMRRCPFIFELMEKKFEEHLEQVMRDAFIIPVIEFGPAYGYFVRYVYDEAGEEQRDVLSMREFYQGYEKYMVLYHEEGISPALQREREKDVHDFLWSWKWYRDAMIQYSGIEKPYLYEPYFFIPYEWLEENEFLFQESGCQRRRF